MSLFGWLRRGRDSGASDRPDPIDDIRALVAAGQPEAAQSAAQALVNAEPDSVDARYFLGSLLAQRGRLDDAVEHLARAVTLAPDHAAAQADLGNVYLLSDRPAEAVGCYEAALRERQDDVELRLSLTRALAACGRHLDALVAIAAVVEAEPAHAIARVLQGNSSLALGDHDGARAAFTAAIESDPTLADAHAGLGSVQFEVRELDAAIASYRRAVELQPGFILALNNLGMALQERGDTAAAREYLGRSVSLYPAPETRLRLALSLPPLMESRAHIAEVRETLDEALTRLVGDEPRIDDPLRGVGLTTFYLAYHALDDLPLQRKLAALYEQATPSLLHVAPHCEEPRPARDVRRIGFVSTYFHDHTIGRTVEGLVAELDRERFSVTLFCFSRREDAIEASLRRHADRVIDLPMDLAAARERIAAEALDVLFYPDIGMHPMTYYLAFARLAPMQCVSCGHPDTTGIGNVDHYLSTALAEPPEASRHYSEQLVTLPALSFHYRRVSPPGPGRTRADLGLADGEHLYLCPQSLFKLHPDFDEVSAGILDGDGRGRLLLLGAPDGADARRLVERLGGKVGGAMDRVTFLPRLPHGDFLSLLGLADVALDPLHFSGGRSTAEILGQGTPIVTLPGEFMRGRMTAAMYAAIGVDDFVVDGVDAYVETALRLGTDRAFRDAGREKILGCVDALYDNPATVRQFEAFCAEAR